MQKEIEVVVSGRVQMVMYRDFAQRKARKLGVLGTVQNVSDGTVHVVAQGEEAVLKKYIAYLRKGSMLSKVSNVDAVWHDPTRTFSDFTIVF